MSDITMRQLLQAGVHFGHQTRYWSPEMAPYIFGSRNKIHIINLEKTLPMLNEAVNYVSTVVAQGGKVLFVSTKRQGAKAVKMHAERSGGFYVNHRWLGGMLTNFKTVKNSIARLKELEQRIESGSTVRLNKKEALTLERERIKLDKTLAGIKDMNGLPDVLFVIDVEQEYIAVAEANKLGIPVVAVVDTNCSSKGIDYVIPGNDDSSRAIHLYLQATADAILDAKTTTRAVSGASAGGENGEPFVEVDDQGEVVEPAAVEETGAVEAELAPEAAEVAAEPSDQADGDDAKSEPADAQPEEGGEEKADDEKKIAKKKVTKKKVVRKRKAVEDEPS